MTLKKSIEKFKLFFKKLTQTARQNAFVELRLPGLYIKVKRNTDINVPHELTVIVPRAEMRKKCLNQDCNTYEYEIIYSSITVVDAPKSPPTETVSILPSKENHHS